MRLPGLAISRRTPKVELAAGALCQALGMPLYAARAERVMVDA
jgi:hypothetical protein